MRVYAICHIVSRQRRIESERERERERGRWKIEIGCPLSIYVYIYNYMCIYIYILCLCMNCVHNTSIEPNIHTIFRCHQVESQFSRDAH